MADGHMPCSWKKTILFNCKLIGLGLLSGKVSTKAINLTTRPRFLRAILKATFITLYFSFFSGGFLNNSLQLPHRRENGYSTLTCDLLFFTTSIFIATIMQTGSFLSSLGQGEKMPARKSSQEGTWGWDSHSFSPQAPLGSLRPSNILFARSRRHWFPFRKPTMPF